MSANAHRLWIDLTDLQTWKGHLTGVQRVAFNIAKRYADSSEEVNYYVFDTPTKRFLETDFAPIRAQIEATQVAQTHEVAAGGDPRSIKQLLKRLPKAVLKRMPESIKQKVPITVKHRMKQGYRRGVGLARQAHHILTQPATQTATLPQVAFAKGDVVLILGSSWDYPELLPALGRLKRIHGFKLVNVLYDLVPTYLPHLFPPPGLFLSYTQNMFETAQLSDGLVSISASSKRDFERFCKELFIPIPPVGLMRLGDDQIAISSQETTITDERIKAGEYIFWGPATLTNRKNIALLYTVYRLAAQRGIDLPTCVIVGGAGWLVGDAIYQIQTDPVTRDKFVFLHANDAEARWLYEHCRFVIYPAVYEGWGLPVGEALGYGKLCLTTNVSSMPEIAGDLIEYFSPYDAGECLDLIVKYLDDKTLHAKEKEIAAQYHQHSWDESYKQFDAFVQKKILK
ncbi:MAG TPA: glycosyltransferase [Candidatus Saccharimonadales bacterium]|nr:glycosyltransferase [Candidatus Saccharimonadales bacterium]